MKRYDKFDLCLYQDILRSYCVKRKIRILFLLILLCICLPGCGKDPELTEFEEAMSDFTDNVTIISDKMNAIEPDSEAAVSQLLSCLDEMNEQFQILAQMDIPSKFISIENITKEAGEYMQEAVSLYHELYESETYDEEKATAAGENYSRAMKRITIISEVLQGEIPDGEGIHITEETATDFEPVREDTDF